MIGLLIALTLAGPLEDGAVAMDRGDWDGAIAAYSEVPRPSWVVQYNLGAAWYRAGDPARAIAYYRGAAQTRPRNGDLAHSLAIARDAVGDPPMPVDPPRAWQAFLSSWELGLAGVLLLASGSGLAIALRQRGRALAWSVLPVLLGLLLLVTALLGVRAEREHAVAVVVDAPAVVREAARPDAAQRFVLPPGSEVRTERTLGGFHLVSTGDGRRGWVPTGAVFAVGIPGPATEVAQP